MRTLGLPAVALAILELGSFPAVAATGTVLRAMAEMHSGPSENADVVSQAIYGINLRIVEERNNWAKVETPDEYTGWMHRASFLTSRKPYATTGQVTMVGSLFANLYLEPNATKHKPVLTVPFETRLEVVSGLPEEHNRWIQVRLADDRAAYLQRGDTMEPGTVLSTAQTIEFSRRFIGLPYTWGGTSTFGYDCSGFMQMLCRRRGVELPRDAGPQSRSSLVVPVDKSSLRPGDLLYFGDSENKIDHTGLYIGNGEFIDATTHERPQVKIDKLSDPHWSKAFVAARRLK